MRIAIPKFMACRGSDDATSPAWDDSTSVRTHSQSGLECLATPMFSRLDLAEQFIAGRTEEVWHVRQLDYPTLLGFLQEHGKPSNFSCVVIDFVPRSGGKQRVSAFDVREAIKVLGKWKQQNIPPLVEEWTVRI